MATRSRGRDSGLAKAGGAKKAARRAPSQRRSRQTVEAIVEAAARVFLRRGYARGTTNQIAAEAGVSIGSLYEYFAGKEALLLAVARRHLDEGQALVLSQLGQTPPGEPLRATLRRAVGAVLDLHRREPALHRMLFEEIAMPRALRREIEQGEGVLVAAVAAALAGHPGARVREPALAAQLVVRTAEALCHGFVLRPSGGHDAGVFVDEVVALLAGYLEAGPEPGHPC